MKRETDQNNFVQTVKSAVNGPHTNSNLQTGYVEEDGGRLSDYWYWIRKRIWLSVGTVLILTGLTAVYMLRLPNLYEARAQTQADLESNNPMLVLSTSNSFV